MPVRSLSSSVLKWPDKKTVDKAVRQWAGHFAQDKNLLGIAYIGSYARGDWGVGSDLDLILVLLTAGTAFWDRSASFDLAEFPVPVDLLVYTADEWRILASENDQFYRITKKEAVWVWRSPEFSP